MKTWLRKLRGVFGSGLIWSGIWSVFGAGVGVIIGMATSFPMGSRVVLGMAMAMAIFGGLAGVSFGLLLTTTQGRKTLSEVSLLGVAAVGLVGGVLAPAALGFLGILSAPLNSFVVLGAFTGVAGALVATSTVALARRADTRERLGESLSVQLPVIDGQTR